MHILGILLAIMTTAGVVLWRLNAAADAAKGLADNVGELRGFFRRRKWQQKANADPLTQIDDPRIAAAAMMVALAQADGAITDAEQKTIAHEIAAAFEANPKLGQELLVHARWLMREPRDLDYVLGKLMAVIQARCAPAEIAELHAMLDRVASADGPARDAERQALDRLKKLRTR